MLFVLLSCSPADQAYMVGSAEVTAPESVTFEAVGMDYMASELLALGNIGHTSLTIDLEVKGRGFSVPVPQVVLGPEESAEVELQFAPYGRDGAVGDLVLTSDVGTTLVALTASTDPDADGDGHEHAQLGGDDCDDTDASVHPDADEVWYDDVDQDCAGGNDFDADGDGYDSDEHGGLDCDDTRPDVFPGAADAWYDGVDSDCSGNSDYDADDDGFDSDAYDGDDCDDTDVRVNPDAEEHWYDGTDQDCSGGSDYDQDGDGVEWPADPDDTDSSVP